MQERMFLLVGDFNPSKKYARQIGNLPQIEVKIKNIWNHHPGIYLSCQEKNKVLRQKTQKESSTLN